MRTTLKRGIGRGAAANGNGRPVLPPGTLSPITIYRQPEPLPRSRWAFVRTALAWSFVGLLVVIGSAAGGAYLWFHQSVAEVVATTPDVKVAAERLDIALPGEPATALVVGYDRRAGEGNGVESRSDTVMLVRADPDTKSISLLSFPRDLFVEVGEDATPFFQALLRQGAIVRPMGAFGAPGALRITVGTPEENAFFADALASALAATA